MFLYTLIGKGIRDNSIEESVQDIVDDFFSRHSIPDDKPRLLTPEKQEELFRWFDDMEKLEQFIPPGAIVKGGSFYFPYGNLGDKLKGKEDRPNDT